MLNVCNLCIWHFQGEIDAREDSFKSTAEAGQKLLDSDHPAIEEVKEKLVTLANEKTTLLELWEVRRVLYEQCMDLQLFYRDTEQADAWMTKQEVGDIVLLCYPQIQLILGFICFLF